MNFSFMLSNFPVFYKISFVTGKQNQNVICKSSTTLQIKYLLQQQYRNQTHHFVLSRFPGEEQWRLGTIAVTACLLARLLTFPKCFQNLFKIPTFAYLGMEKDKAGRLAIILILLQTSFIPNPLTIPIPPGIPTMCHPSAKGTEA